MPLFKFISVKLCAALIVGILIGFYIPMGAHLPYILLIICFSGLAVAYATARRNRFPMFGVLFFLSTVALGLVLVNISLGRMLPHNYQKCNLGHPHSVKLKISNVLKPTAYADRYDAHICTLDKQQVTGTVTLNISKDGDSKRLDVDDELWVQSTLKEVQPALNTHQFDYQAYLQKQGIFHQINITPNQYILSQNSSMTLFGLAHHFREQLISKLNRYDFGDEELSIIQALLLGKRSDISEETYNNYKNAGAVHILAVSGLHVGILLLILHFLLNPIARLRYGKTLKLIAIIALLWVFAFTAGLSSSIVRAVTMFSFLAYALYLNRPTNTFNIIALSLFFILLIKPLLLFQVGFQMSYAAVIAIVWGYPKLQRFWYPKNWLIRKTWQSVSVSFMAQLGVLPISLFYFHQFPALFFVSNLIVVPFLGIILGGGILVLLLAALQALPNFLVFGYHALIKWMNHAVSWVGNQEGFVFREISFDEIQLILAYLTIFAFMAAVQQPKFKKVAFLSIAIMLFQGWTIFLSWKSTTPHKLIAAHQTANTILLHQNGNHLQVLSRKNEKAKRIVTDYKVGERIDSVSGSSLKNSYQINGKLLLLIDSTAVVPTQKEVDYLLLTQSPQINLERVLDSLRPKFILADGSNYKSYIKRWQKTCQKRKLPFHYTGEKGAYIFELR